MFHESWRYTLGSAVRSLLSIIKYDNRYKLILINKVYPVVREICDKLRSSGEVPEVVKVRDVYTLCCNQIKKCIVNLLDIFRMEHDQAILLQESRQCNLERLQWCINKLVSVDIYLGNNLLQNGDDTANDSLSVTVMYFVNWIDHTFDVLNKLSDTIYRTDYKDNNNIYNLWKNDVVEYVSELNVSIDELLLSAMTLCRYCLPNDQHVVKARCQVVFRETKALLSEIVQGDLSSPVKINLETLRLPIMPSNVNILIDVLRNVLYVLETNTNTALLALLIYCFSYSMSPIEILKQHFTNSKQGTCSCLNKIDGDITQDCIYVKEFDLYNERLLQIGSFAVSCSADQSRTLNLRSGLASLEGLDPHLVPALMMSPDSHHSRLLMNSWHQEVQEIRDSVFLIVDPAAFAEKSKQMLRQKLLEMLKRDVYNNTETCFVINIGFVVYEFFEVYERYEPDAVMEHEKIASLLADLKKVLNECKIVSNLLSSPDDYHYDVKTPKDKKIYLNQLLKRLKLLYTVVNRINAVLIPNENDDQLLLYGDCGDDCDLKCDDATHTIYKNNATYVNSPRKLNNLSRTIFSRTIDMLRSSKKSLPLAKLTKNLRLKKCDEISFSVQLDRLFNETNHLNNSEVSPNNSAVNPNNSAVNPYNSEVNLNNSDGKIFTRNCSHKIREPSILYNFSPAKRSSMRRMILNRHYMSNDKSYETGLNEESVLDTDSLMEDTSLQITDILNQMNDLTNITSTNNMSRSIFTNKPVQHNQTYEKDIKDKGRRNVLRANIDNNDTSIAKHVWNKPVNVCIMETDFDDSELVSSMSTPPSNVTTMERIYDLELVENKLDSLKSQLETSL